MYPSLTRDETHDWINNIYSQKGIKDKFKSFDELNEVFDYLISHDGLLFWRSKVDDPVFNQSDRINVSGTHSYGELVNDQNIWTSVDEDWIRRHLLSNDVPVDIRDMVKDLMNED